MRIAVNHRETKPGEATMRSEDLVRRLSGSEHLCDE
jgi:hypothetical protein